MASFGSFELNSPGSKDSAIFWHSLKQAIAASSGFKRWKLERGVHDKPSDLTLDDLVQSYLRETLETLAY
jgi:hypothetical protein